MSESPYIVEITADNYQQIVIEGSFQVPVLVDFWADWCQPCKILMPMLAKLVDEYQGKFILAKINTEQQQELATQSGIRSIPTVKLFKNGQPVDEFSGALPEEEVRQFLDRHIPRESDQVVAQARQLLLQEDADAALTLLAQAQSDDPANHNISIALAQTFAAMGDTESAVTVLDKLPQDIHEQEDVIQLRRQLHFDSISKGMPDQASLEQRLAADESDSEARFQLAAHKINNQEYESALELLLNLMRVDRQYDDDAARKTMLQIFELLGDDPLVPRYRSKMMSLIY
jgi:putative thioredoxin